MKTIWDIAHIAMTPCKCPHSCIWCCYNQHQRWISCHIEDMAIDMILDGLY